LHGKIADKPLQMETWLQLTGYRKSLSSTVYTTYSLATIHFATDNNRQTTSRSKGPTLQLNGQPRKNEKKTEWRRKGKREKRKKSV